MRASIAAPLFLVALAAPAAAQGLDGRWVGAVTMPDGNILEISTVITGNTYITNASGLQSGPAGTYQYFASQSGEVMFTPPDNLRLVVTDWSPKSQGGFPVHMPPNGNYTILALDAQRMTIVDSICTMSAPAPQCTNSFRKVN